MKRIISEESPAVVALVETKLPEDEDIVIEGYQSRKMNRDEKGGGVMLLVKEELNNIVIVVEEKKEVGEIMWVTISNVRTNIRMGILYAPQENKTTVSKLKEMYKGISNQIKEAKTKMQNVLLVGDFNCKVGKTIKENTEDVSKGGKLLLKMVSKQDLNIMNSSETCQGVWTRTDGKKKSILDYIIVNKEDEELVKEMIIDEERDFTPSHTQDGRKIYSDHYSIKVDINWNMRYKAGENKRTIIDEKSKTEFENRTTEVNLTDIWEKENSSQEKYSEWNKKVIEIAEITFIKKKKKRKEMKAVRMLKRRKKEIKRNFSEATPQEKEIYLRRKKLIDEHIENHKKEDTKRRTFRLANRIKSEKGFDGSAFWEYKKISNGRKSESMTSMKNEEGKIEEDPKQILMIYQKFYQKLLTAREMTTESGKQIE